MQRTVLLLDGSEAMNNSGDYLPSYLLAIRNPVYEFIAHYLESSPLVSLGVVVIRDGVCRRLVSPTTNYKDIVSVLERDYFLYGGSGSFSLVNGLRLSLSELVDMKRIVAATQGGKVRGLMGAVDPASRATRRRIVLLSASVTVVDPTNVEHTLSLVAGCDVRLDVISFTGAVHVFERAAEGTGGKLYCPLSYDHLTRLMHQLIGESRASGSRKRSREKKLSGSGEKSVPIAVGFPLCEKITGSGDYTLLCPQCHLPQSAVPTTCPLCRCTLCDVASLFGSIIVHNHFVPQDHKVKDPDAVVICHLCRATQSSDKVDFYRCEKCTSLRCFACNVFVHEKIGMCPVCVSLV
ncbi:transcription initiation factor TFIIH subunit 2 [Angomonas deanei]|nr:transcription initiation factor TFIIH subunit 2 [Angomonas deanei]|eukprot:EPY41459.1 transcription initiation factor TFIIH subunit 2 [Angomonas deanei]